jgi:hypothetical protein
MLENCEKMVENSMKGSGCSENVEQLNVEVTIPDKSRIGSKVMVFDKLLNLTNNLNKIHAK